MKLVKAFLLSLVFVFAFSVTALAAEVSVTIFHTNDIHGRFEPSGTAMGIDTMAAIYAATENAILIDAGDTFHGMPFVTLGRGINAVELMNAAGFSLMTPGNHEFNFGLDRLLELETLADFGFLSANVFWRADSTLVFDAYTTVEIAGVTLGFFGLATPDTPFVTHPANVADIYFGDPVEAAQAAVAALQAAGADVIIGITHLGLDGTYTSVALAEAVPEIDLIVDGHSHDLLPEGMWVNGVLIVQTHEHGRNLGRVDITLADGATDLAASVITRDYALENFEPVEAITDMLAYMAAVILEAHAEVVGYSPVFLEGDRAYVRTQEMPIGNFIADSFLWATDAQLALLNSGGIRDSLPAGALTIGDVLTTLAFPNFVVVVEVTAAQLWAALEHGVSGWPADVGRFPQIAGFAFDFNGYAEPGERVSAVYVDGENIYADDPRTFTLAINDFLASGGDAYEMLDGLPVVSQAGIMSDIFIEFLAVADIGEAAVEGRMINFATIEPISMPTADPIDTQAVEIVVTPTEPDPEPVVVEPPVSAPVITVHGTATVANCWFLNVRSGPGAGHPAINHLARGNVVTVLESTAWNWHRIQFGTITGWVYGVYLDFN